MDVSKAQFKIKMEEERNSFKVVCKNTLQGTFNSNPFWIPALRLICRINKMMILGQHSFHLRMSLYTNVFTLWT